MADCNPSSSRPDATPQVEDAESSCDECLLARRTFLTIATMVGLSVGVRGAAALPVRAGRAVATAGGTVTYRTPLADGATFDAVNAVVLVRWQGHLYAFSALCPHKQASVQWYASAREFICPKHKAHYSAVGVHLSGRATRNLDRHPLRRVGADVVVDTSTTYESDRMPAQWASASIAV